MSDWHPTHRAPSTGLDARESPDAALPVVARLDPWLDVRVAQWWGDWAQVECANGWWAWVDGRVLVSLDAPAPTPAPLPAAPASAAGLSGSALGARARAAVPAAGAVAVGIAALLPWVDFRGESANAFDVEAQFLLSYDSTTDLGVDVGVLLVVLGIVGIVVAVLVDNPWWRRGVGIAVALVALDFVVQLQRLLGTGPSDGRPGLLSTIGFGVYIALVGAAALALAPARPSTGAR